MTGHGGAGSFRIAPLDPLQNRFMFGDDLRHPSDLRQGQASIPIDMNLHLQDQLPYSRIARNLSDPRMKHLVRLMKGFSVLRSAGLALAFERRVQVQELAGGRVLGGHPGRGFLKGLADDDGLGKRRDRNARNENARLGKYLHQPLIRELQDGFTHRRSADAVGGRDLRLRDRLTWSTDQRHELGPQIGIDARSGCCAPRPTIAAHAGDDWTWRGSQFPWSTTRHLRFLN